MTQKHIFLVEDDEELACLISDFLRRYGFRITHFGQGNGVVEQVIAEQPDLVILDVMLPGMNGMDICRNIRPYYSGLILMQTALDDDVDQMMGLEIGADDYVIKQVQPRLLLSRINALLRRGGQNGAEMKSTNTQDVSVLTSGSIRIDLATRVVSIAQQVIDLTTAEYELLCLLARSEGQVVCRDDIILELRGYEYDGLDRSVDRRISRLRRKLGDDPETPKLIKTIRGKGYQLCPS